MHRLQPRCFANQLAGKPTSAFKQNISACSNACRVKRALPDVDDRLKTLQPFVHHRRRNLIIHQCRRCAGARRIFEAIGHRIARALYQCQRLFKLGIALTREANDKITRYRNVRANSTNAVDNPKIALAAMAAVHCLKDAVAARLNGQMQEGHQRLNIAVRLYQPFGHIIRVARHIADTQQSGDFIHRADQRIKPASPLFPRIDVLAKQCDFFRAAINQRARFVQYRIKRARDFGPTRVRHHTISAEFIASLLHRQECSRPRFAARRQHIKFCQARQIKINRALAANHGRNHSGQGMIGLWANDNIDITRALGNLRPFGLRNAACHRDHRAAAVLTPQPANIRIDLVDRLFTDVTGVENNEISVGLHRLRHAFARQHFAHAFAVIDVHLAPEGFNVIGFGGRASHCLWL